jgi:ferrochelatase
MAKRAVLLLAHGTPETVAQIPEYLRNVVSGRPMPQSVVEEIQHRYSLIGRSPLTEITQQQARLVEGELASEGDGISVYVGMRNWRPYIPDVVRQMRADGVDEAAVICMAPQNSRTSVGLYRRAVAAEAGGLRIDFTAGWAHHPLLIEAFAERLRVALTKLSSEVGSAVPVLFTAHSVPLPHGAISLLSRRVNLAIWPGEGIDPYAVGGRRQRQILWPDGFPRFPSGGSLFRARERAEGPWIGPSVESTLDAIAEANVRALILQPIGFLCDHVEILYDVDIAFREYAAKLGLRLERPESLNAIPDAGTSCGAFGSARDSRGWMALLSRRYR